MFGYNCEKRHGSFPRDWARLLPARKARRKDGRYFQGLLGGANKRRPTASPKKNKNGSSPPRRSKILSKIEREFRFTSPARQSVQSSFDTSAIRDSLTDAETILGSLNPLEYHFGIGRMGSSRPRRSPSLRAMAHTSKERLPTDHGT